MSSYPSIYENSPFMSEESRTPLMSLQDAASDPLPLKSLTHSSPQTTNNTYQGSFLNGGGERSYSQPISEHASLPSPTLGVSQGAIVDNHQRMRWRASAKAVIAARDTGECHKVPPPSSTHQDRDASM